MKIEYKKLKNENEIEYQIVNFDYFDGDKYLFNIFSNLFGALILEENDFIWFKTLKIKCVEEIYILQWHEDIGNSIKFISKNIEQEKIAENRIIKVIEELNKIILSKDLRKD